MEDDGGFSFPVLPQPKKAPLTAASTVTDLSKSQHGLVEAKPVPIKSATGDDTLRQPIKPGKVPFEIGYSQMDWIALCRKKPDLTGIKSTGTKSTGFRRDIQHEEVALHNTADDAWIVINFKVFNLTPYLKFHPGGVDVLKKVFGKDGTKLFNKFHPWVNADALLQNCWIGLLDKESRQRPK